MLIIPLAMAHAQSSCGNNDSQLTSDTTPQGLLVASTQANPAGYRGYITTGNMAPGVWKLRIDDSGWPTKTKQRRDYIMENFYVYDAVNKVFRATFSMSEAAMQLINADLMFDWVPAQVTLEAVDADQDGVFDNTEFNGNQTLIAAVDASCGTSAPLCGGQGNANGNVLGDGGVVQSSPLVGALLTQTCATPVEKPLWGDVKQLYRD
jgi:hypothetical protein